MALHRKWSSLMDLDADVAVICEAAHPELLRKRGCDLSRLSYVWAGRVKENRNKGLLVLAKSKYKLDVADHWDPNIEIFLPVEISGAERFNLLATWSFNRRSVGGEDPKPQALALYKQWLDQGLMIGDFNSHVRWDRPSREWTFRRFVDALNQAGFESLYHQRNALRLGEEEATTLYWRSRRPDKDLYHVDYFFAHQSWHSRCLGFEVGSYEDWVQTKLSDHVPLIADFRAVDLKVCA